MRKSWLAALAVAGLNSPALAAEPTGDWLVADKVAAVRIAPCGPAFCGHIAWTKGPPRNDKNNPDPAKRSRSVIGMETLLNMKPAGSNRWEGEIYNAEDGKIYAGSISLVSDNVLRIEGCVWVFCGGQNWTRAQCEEAPAARPGGRGPTPPQPQPVPLASCREAVP